MGSEEQAVFRALSVFRGTYTVDSAPSVVGRSVQGVWRAVGELIGR